MVKKSKELDKQYEYFLRRISNTIADIGICFGLLLSLVCFVLMTVGYYVTPAVSENDYFAPVFLEDIFFGIYALLDFIIGGLVNYINNLPGWVQWCYVGIIAGIVIFFAFIALFWEELEKEEEDKMSDSEIWTEKPDKEPKKEDGSHIYEWKVRLVNSSAISEDLRKSLSLDIEEILEEWGYVTEIKSEEKTNEVP